MKSHVGPLGPLVAFVAAVSVACTATAEVVAVVSARSPVTTLTRDQASDIFLGKSNRFPDGTSAQPIDLVEGSPARDEFYLVFAGKSPAQVKAHWSKIIFTGRGRPPPDVANGAEIRKRLAEHPGAIGYLAPDMVDANVRIVAR